MKKRLLFAFYGDDFTGSTDALEFLSRAGIKTVLFMEVPTAEQLQYYPDIEAIGVAGMTRAMGPEAMRTELQQAFNALNALGVEQLHYKVCSTFDSSPRVGNIGVAAEVGAAIFKPAFIPLLLAAPTLGRYTLFGNHFAQMGIGSQGEIYRLDRHPSISKHPVTPMKEADLRLHLAAQTNLPVGLVDILSIKEGAVAIQNKLERCTESGDRLILFDAMETSDLTIIATVMDQYIKEAPLFSIGSSGVEMAWGTYWENLDATTAISNWPQLEETKRVLVLSGSCSPVTSKQISHAVSQGFKTVAIPALIFASEEECEAVIKRCAGEAIAFMKEGYPVIIHTHLDEDDPRKLETHELLIEQGYADDEVSVRAAQVYGRVLGQITLQVAKSGLLQRLVIAGGDTSSYVARNLGITAVEMIRPFSFGAPLCRAHASKEAIDGIEINFKGGQVGNEYYFTDILKGSISKK
ncbi:four-carbon acid sugar kinase family protein [Arachidicoccus terrestris]|uniref:four-carbon acid sugar kinase family protein n=1 Tax=Arachidicoccus terrestris TaxID=2875539 RepID=UPI001CC41DA2|nr:four-carbon acid sugar kinase family protein [Arachidicoccus terrestris]UAY56721.1 four-carbon acid sugar kinase family protein [Arachidicoccus terrestris]